MVKIYFLILSFLTIFLIPPAYTDTITSLQESKRAVVSVQAFKPITREDGQEGRFEQRGAGIIIDPSGIIATNLHTVNQMPYIHVTLHTGNTYKAKVIQVSPHLDVVFLKIEVQEPLNAISFADPRSIQLGSEVIYVGHSYWLKGTLYGGKITGLGKNKNTNHLDIFEINMDVYHGDSGGPILNSQGEFLGLMMAKRIDRHKSSFAIPAYKIRQMQLDLIQK